MRDRGVRHERRGRYLVGNGVDRNMCNIKLIIPAFKGMSNSETYLE